MEHLLAHPAGLTLMSARIITFHLRIPFLLFAWGE